MKTTPTLNLGIKDGAKILVAMSGGVDSSVAAALLKLQGFNVIGVHMQLYDSGQQNFERGQGRCCSIIDSNDARKVCDKIDIPYYVINVEDKFNEKVIDHFVHEYLKLRTPNPCVECNSSIKFDYLFDKATELGCEYVATGHYARVYRDASKGVVRLLKGIDPKKDQSYFLFGMEHDVLNRVIMPLGDISKERVRKIAEEFSLVNAEKPDSQEICFIDDGGYQGFIEKRTTENLRPKGYIRTSTGDVVGQHEGLYRYTIGQRKGLQLSIQEDENKLHYVVGYNQAENELIVGFEEELYHKELIATKVSWLNPIDKLHAIKCRAKIRSMSKESECIVTCFQNEMAHVDFKEPQRAITPGQAIVFYNGDEVLGGGFIEKTGGIG